MQNNSPHASWQAIGDDGFSDATDGSSRAVRVDAEQGTPLPEHACGEDGGYISLLKRVERCCIESDSAEIERAIAALSLKPKSDQVGDVATSEASQEAEGGGRRGMFKREAFLGVMSPPVAEAAFSA